MDPRKALTQYGHDNWNSDSGLPQNAVLCIEQGDDGYLWFGTQEGLARFDGVRFQVFDPQSSQFPDIFVSALLKDRDGSLWIGTQAAGVVHLVNGRFEVFGSRQGMPHNYVYALHQDRHGAVWIGTQGGGLAKLENGRLETFSVAQGLADNIVWSIAEDKTGSLWIGTNRGLSQFRSGAFVNYTTKQGLPANIVRALSADDAGGLWIGTEGGLSKFADGRFGTYTTADGLPHNRVSAIRLDSAGILWIGTEGGGLARLHNGRFETYGTRKGLSSDLVLSIFEDREGSIWVGTTGGGLDRFRDTKFTVYTTREGLSHDVVRSIFQDSSGAIWFGTGGGGLSRLEHGRFSTFSTRDGLPNDIVRSFYEDRNHRLWVGTHGGLAQFNGREWKRYSVSDGLSNPIVYAICGDREGDLWIGTEGGLNRWRDGTFEVFTTAQGMPHDVVRVLHKDRNGHLWIGTRGGGLARYENGLFKTFTTKDGLGSNVILDLYEDQDGTLWIGTGGGGLSEYRNGRFTTFRAAQGLFDDVIMRILEDNQGNLWMTCNKGIFRVSKGELRELAEKKRKEVRSISYGRADGMLSRECNGGSQPAGWRTQDGHLWFPTLQGAVTIDPGDIRINRQAPSVLLEEIIANDSRLDATKETVLGPSTNKLEFRYTALSFMAPELVRFRYMLQGFDRAWVDAGNRRVAYYTSLPSGDYRFQVIACNNDGIWNEQGASFAFRQKPFFYKTGWFYGLLLTTITLGGLASYRLHIRHLKTRQHELTRLVAERTRELEGANQELQRLSTIDGLTGIPNRRHCDERLREFWRRTARARAPFSAILIDIDLFKLFNDHFGHQRGDECLKQVAQTIASTSRRAGDLPGRFGGEEFLMLLPETDADGALRVAKQLTKQMEALAIPHPQSSVAPIVTLSIGVATVMASNNLAPEVLLGMADEALYEAKRRGRNQIVQRRPDQTVSQSPSAS